MKIVTLISLLLVVALAAPLLAVSEIVIDDSSGRTVGRIRENGDVEESSGWTIGRVRENGDVENSSGWTIGRVRDNGSIEDSSGWTIGRVRDNGSIEDSSGWTIGTIRSDAIENSSGSTVLRFSGPADNTRLAAYVFFFNRVLKK